MEKDPGGEKSPETADVIVVSKTTKRRRKKLKQTEKTPDTHEGEPACRDVSLQQVKREAVGEAASTEAACSSASAGTPKVGSKRKQKEKSAGDKDQKEKKTPKKKKSDKEKGSELNFLKQRSPEKRQVNVTSKDIQEGEMPNKTIGWAKGEKVKLLAAIEKYGANDWTNILKEVPRKSQKQLESYYRNLRVRCAAERRKWSTSKAPIEHWLEAAEAVTMFDYDYSNILPEIMSIAGYLEPHDTPRPKVSTDPDWGQIYQYLASLMKGGNASPEDLSPIEAAVLLDLLQNLSDSLNSLNTGRQRELMEKKHEHLIQNATMYRKTREEEALYHGLDKDPLVDSIPPYVPVVKPSTSTATSSSTDQQHQPSASSSSAPSASSAVKKSKLFSINPFCIPVKYLRPSLNQ